MCDKCSTKFSNSLNFSTLSYIFENKGNVKAVLNESVKRFEFVSNNNTLSTIFNTFHNLLNDLFKCSQHQFSSRNVEANVEPFKRA